MEKRISVSELAYPRLLGEGGELSCMEIYEWKCGCAVIQDMVCTGKLADSFDWVIPDATAKILSKLSSEQKELCKSSPLCAKLICKMTDGTYAYNYDKESDNICVYKSGAQYIPYEGKHRACCAKNFLSGDALIPVNVGRG